MDAVNPKKSGRYKEKALDKFWDKVEQLEKKDPDIALELRNGRRVTILEDSDGDIDIPDYPDSNY